MLAAESPAAEAARNSFRHSLGRGVQHARHATVRQYEPGNVLHPVPVGSQLNVPDTCTTKRNAYSFPLRRARRIHSGPGIRVTSFHVTLEISLGITDQHVTGVGELDLPPIDDLDRQDLVAYAQPSHGALPLGFYVGVTLRITWRRKVGA